MKFWIGNIAPGTSDEDVRAFVTKYAPGLEIKSIQRVDGLHRMHWKGRELFVQTLSR